MGRTYDLKTRQRFVRGAPQSTSAQDMHIIQLPDNFTASTTELASTWLGDLTPILLILISVFAASIVIEILIHAIKPK